MCSRARSHVTWHNYKRRGQALEGRGSLGGQVCINNERQKASHSDAFKYPDGGFFVIKSKLKLYTTEIFESQGPIHENRIYPPSDDQLTFLLIPIFVFSFLYTFQKSTFCLHISDNNPVTHIYLKVLFLLPFLDIRNLRVRGSIGAETQKAYYVIRISGQTFYFCNFYGITLIIQST